MAKAKKTPKLAKEPKTVPANDKKSDKKGANNNDKKGATNANDDKKGNSKFGKSNFDREKYQQTRQNLTAFTNWTGKLPCTLLHEHCQKQKWEKVQYDLTKLGDRGFIATAILAWRNPQDNQIITIKYKPPYVDLEDPKKNVINPVETAIEARHLIATFTLHRICFEKNLQLMLPPQHKKIWGDLERERKDYLKQNPDNYKNVYNAQPFANWLQNEVARKKKEKQKEIQREQESRQAEKTEIVIGGSLPKPANGSSSKKPSGATHSARSGRESATKSSSSRDANDKNQNQEAQQITASMRNLKLESSVPRFPRKAWDQAPLFDLKPEIRESIEASIKHHINWTAGKTLADSDQAKDAELVLAKLGFRASHAKEALGYATSLTQALEWLIFHLPEDDLPVFFSKQRKDSKVNVKIAADLKLEKIVLELQKSGYDQRDIVREYKAGGDNKGPGLISGIVSRLTLQLLSPQQRQKVETLIESNAGNNTNNEDYEEWVNEIEGLRSIYPDKIRLVEPDMSIINIKITPAQLGADLISVNLHFSKHYPFSIVGLQICIKENYKLASYIKLAILKNLAAAIVDSLAGDMYVFAIIEHLEEVIAKLIADPGPLYSNSSGLAKAKAKARSALSSQQRASKDGSSSSSSRGAKRSSSRRNKIDVEAVKLSYEQRMADPAMRSKLASRATLPAYAKRSAIVEMINANKVTLVTGETGSGKSTQVVQFILDYLNSEARDFQTSVIVTQPRRISTLGLADRISDERLDSTGNETGYVIRGENRTSKVTRVTFATTGILLRMIQGLLSSGAGDGAGDGAGGDMFDSLGYIFIDEVHERSVESDLLLTILKSIMHKLPKLKIVLMSATIDVQIFNEFFKTEIGNIHIEGRTFPIQDYYLDDVLASTNFAIVKKKKKNRNFKQRYVGNDDDDDDDLGDDDGDDDDGLGDGDTVISPKPDSPFFQRGNINYDLIAALCLQIDEQLCQQNIYDGSVLVFLPGVMEINRCIASINAAFKQSGGSSSSSSGGDLRSAVLYPLHSALAPKEQKRVFDKVGSKKMRKFVISTNIAETSITIPDCVAVIDAGRVKSMHFDHQLKATKLVEQWCSRAEAKQRRGRAGRVREGVCYKLYTRETELQRMQGQPVPEILRVSLDRVYLVVKLMGIGQVGKFLKSGLSVPSESNIAQTKHLLTEIGALDVESNGERLTDLGKYLAILPTDISSGKLLILGTIFGCVEKALTIAAVSSSGSPFVAGANDRDKVKLIKQDYSSNNGNGNGNGNGDIIAMANVVESYLNAQDKKRFLKDHCLAFTKLKEILSTRLQLVLVLQDAGFIPFEYKRRGSFGDSNNNNNKLVRTIVASAMYPQISRAQHPDPKFIASHSGAVEVDPDAKHTRFWIRNPAFGGSSEDNAQQQQQQQLPALRAFIHPNSVFFSSLDSSSSSAANKIKTDFVAYAASHHSTKLYLTGITPVSVLAVLLFGGKISYDLSLILSSSSSGGGSTFKSPGLVLDGWLPIRTWCKNGVLIKVLRLLLDRAIEQKLARPAYKETTPRAKRRQQQQQEEEEGSSSGSTAVNNGEENGGEEIVRLVEYVISVAE